MRRKDKGGILWPLPELPRPLLFIIAVAVVAMLLTSCATIGVKPFEEMTPKEKTLAVVSQYNRAFESYLREVARPGLTEAEVVVLRAKKQILTELKPLIATYVLVFETGGVPSAEDEAHIVDLIHRLGLTLAIIVE